MLLIILLVALFLRCSVSVIQDDTSGDIAELSGDHVPPLLRWSTSNAQIDLTKWSACVRFRFVEIGLAAARLCVIQKDCYIYVKRNKKQTNCRPYTYVSGLCQVCGIYDL